MKKIFLLILGLMNGMFIFAQNPQFNVGDTIAWLDTISFEEPTPYIQIIPTAANIWQIGKPQKVFFNNAYSPPNAIVTDTVADYPKNNLSYFDLYIGNFNFPDWFYPMDIFIDFRHKFDTDTLKDGGYISVSWDYGQTFMNVIEDTVYPGSSPAFNFWPGSTNIYSKSDVLYNGEFGFSGKSNGWVHSSLAWHFIPVKNDFIAPDTMIIRFNFISDSIDHPKEGWMIDQIRLFSVDVGSGIPEADQNGIRIFPNPFKESATVLLPEKFKEINYRLFDNTGRLVRSEAIANADHFIIRKNNLDTGIYLLKMILDGNKTVSRRVVIL